MVAVDSLDSLRPEDLFHGTRLARDEMRWWHWLLLVLWAPAGLLLVAFRLVAGLMIGLLAPPRFRAWWLLLATGVMPRPRRRLRIAPSGTVLVSNHQGYLDGYVIQVAVKSPRPPATLLWHKVNAFTRWLARPWIPVFAAGRNAQLRERIRTYLADGNVTIFPEGTVSDGRTGVLRFQPMAFELDAPVAVIALRYRRPLPFLRPSALEERLFVEVLFDFFQPFVVAEVECLGVYRRAPEEKPLEFADRAQERVAAHLGLSPTGFTWKDRRAVMAVERRARSRAP